MTLSVVVFNNLQCCIPRGETGRCNRSFAFYNTNYVANHIKRERKKKTQTKTLSRGLSATR